MHIASTYNLNSGKTTQCSNCKKIETNNKRVKNQTGNRFGRLLIIEEFQSKPKRKVRCLCDCGNEIVVSKTDVTSGHTQSCGCLQAERTGKANEKDWTDYISNYGVKILNQTRKNNKGQWLWNCRCFCGNEFEILPIKITSGHTTSCGCRRQSSKEEFIKNILTSNNIEYKRQYSFPDCKNKYILKFDFAIIKDGEVFSLIEYDGMQHYKPINHFGGLQGFNITVKRDNIKNEYCKKHNIPLIRIKYDKSDEEIKNIIANILNP